MAKSRVKDRPVREIRDGVSYIIGHIAEVVTPDGVTVSSEMKPSVPRARRDLKRALKELRSVQSHPVAVSRDVMSLQSS